MYFAIYALLDEKGDPFYVGSTNNIYRRMKEHRKARGVKPVYRILEEGYVGRFLAEEKWIKHYQNLGYFLTNKAEFFGGRVCVTPYTRALLSEKLKGRPKPDGFNKHLSEAYKGKPREWTEDGRAQVQKTQFGLGHGPINEDKRKAAIKAHWASLSAEKKSEIARRTNLKAWAARSPDARSRIGQKIRDTRRRNHTADELSAIAKNNGLQLIKRRPNIGSEARARMQNWWANLTPEYRAEYLRKRTEKLREAKALKRADG